MDLFFLGLRSAEIAYISGVAMLACDDFLNNWQAPAEIKAAVSMVTVVPLSVICITTTFFAVVVGLALAGDDDVGRL